MSHRYGKRPTRCLRHTFHLGPESIKRPKTLKYTRQTRLRPGIDGTIGAGSTSNQPPNGRAKRRLKTPQNTEIQATSERQPHHRKVNQCPEQGQKWCPKVRSKTRPNGRAKVGLKRTQKRPSEHKKPNKTGKFRARKGPKKGSKLGSKSAPKSTQRDDAPAVLKSLGRYFDHRY
jgi:hypothetical protein